jgi:hypothetical protein
VATVPQDIYTSATATIGSAEFTCITLLGPTSQSPGSIDISEYAYGYVPNSQVTVNLASPITVTGTDMALSLDMQVLPSATYGSCAPVGVPTYSINPTFNLTTTTLSASPTNSGNGLVSGLEGTVTAIATSGNEFTVGDAEGPMGTKNFAVTTSSSTVYQGVNSFSALAVGMFINMDGAIQSDGSIVATRIAVDDPTALNIWTGPILLVGSEVPVLLMYGRQEQGAVVTNFNPGGYFDLPYLDFSSTLFQVSRQMTNLQSLPFTPSFSASNMVAGQNVDITSGEFVLEGGVYTAATTMTLIPQTINGSVVGSSTSGDFTEYTVDLDSYSLFPTLSAQPGQNTLLTNPGVVEVYVDSNTQMLNSASVVSGGTFRFYGLVFNDNGTLRMDCAQVSDGATTSTQTNAMGHGAAGAVHMQLHESPRGTRNAITTVTHSY